MYLVHIDPIARGAPHTLTYASRVDYQPYDCIRITLRGKEGWGMVRRTEDAAQAKARLKSAGHVTNPIRAQTPRRFFSAPFAAACVETATGDASPVGALLARFFDPEAPDAAGAMGGSYFEARMFVRPRDESVEWLVTIAREHLSRGESPLIITPTHAEAVRLEKAIASGIPDAVLLVTGSLSKKERRARMDTLHSNTPKVMVANAQSIALPRTPHAIYLTQYGAPSYEPMDRPHIDTRRLIEAYARAAQVPLTFLDIIPSVALELRTERGTLHEVFPTAWQLRHKAPLRIIDKRMPEHRGVLSHDAHTLLAGLSPHDTALVLVGRKGIAGIVSCADCRTPVTCTRCTAPLALSGAKRMSATPYFHCRRCGAKRDSREYCRTCGSWKLMTAAVGSEGVAKEIARTTSRTVTRLDTDTAKTDTAAERIAQTFMEHGGVLVATERALPFLSRPMTAVIALSFDALLSVPDARAGERAFRILAEAGTLAERTFLMETRQPEHPVLSALLSRDARTFITREKAEREALSLPPYATLVTISFTGTKERVQKALAALAATLHAYHPKPIPWEDGVARGAALLFFLPDEKLPEPLMATLATLPPSFVVRVVR